MTTKHYLTTIITMGAALLLWGCNAATHKGVASPHAMHAPASKASSTTDETRATMALDLRGTQNLDSIIPALETSRVVFVGEQHDSYAHHLAQLDVIKRLHEKNPNIAIGMEMFQRPFQPYLDDYVAGVISEADMLRKTEWYDRWRFDFRLYKPILDYAKEHKLPLIALNVEREMTEKVSASGIAGLAEDEKKKLPSEINKDDKVYEARLKDVFNMHPNRDSKSFEHFVESQLLWDETMAERAAAFLDNNPNHQLVVLAGSGHLMFGSGIPNRVVRRVPVEKAIVLPGDAMPVRAGVADFLIYPPMADLPKNGLMGVMMGMGEKGVVVEAVVPDSGADKAGIEKDDILKQIDDQEIHTTTDVRIHMQNKKPGEKVKVKLLREKLLVSDELLTVEVELSE